MFSRFLIAVAAAAVVLGGSVCAKAAEVLNFGIISTESSQNLKQLWDPFLADMEKATGFKVKAFFASDYAGIIEGMRFKKVDLCWIVPTVPFSPSPRRRTVRTATTPCLW